VALPINGAAAIRYDPHQAPGTDANQLRQPREAFFSARMMLVRRSVLLPLLVILALASACSKKPAAEAPVAAPAVSFNHPKAALGSPVEVSYTFTVPQGAPRMDQDYRVMVHFLDADEELSPELVASIRRVLAGAPEAPGACGYEMNRLAWHLGRWVRHGDWHPDWKLRLFRRSRVRWCGRNPHGRAEVDGPVERLTGDLRHYSYRDLADQLERIQSHTRVAAEALHRAGRRATVSDLVLRPPARFLRGYLLKGGFRDGLVGFVVAAAVAWGVFLKYAKLWELWQGEGPARQR